ncbi:uncharacterized protein LOC119684831 [Teleopsis dalmanni]|uniref:uncharacterized protein LOC119684831 n=1 Tax=Teleopsis dalmanni TaxID=139649 RepID=UPI0018CF72B3|nr:uncharacterized protein LOC119684831 [Teleopsis dalmanni]
MAQPSIAAYFNTRKRAVIEDNTSIKNRRLIEPTLTTTQDITTLNSEPSTSQSTHIPHDDEITLLKKASSGELRTRSGRKVKRIGAQQIDIKDVIPKKISKIEQSSKQKKLVEFIKKGPLSPRKKCTNSETSEMQKLNEETPKTNIIATAFADKNSITNVQRGFKTPTKQIIKGSTPIKRSEFKSLVKKELNFDEVKTKVSRSAKLQELKASLSRIQELEKTRKAQEERNRLLREGVTEVKKTPVVQLKEFDTIELEILTSPSKTHKTPTKRTPPTPNKNELMSPRHTDVSKRVLFSPAKNGTPSKLVVPPAYQRFLSLIETSKAGQLPLPFKYRHLIEIFKGLDSVCAMFHNRKECITFKKLKPAVQRMLRKNFHESHLAQIKYLYPEAYNFTQVKMRNYGSASKADYFQLVVVPNVENASDKQTMTKIDEDNILASGQSTAMNPQVMTERLQRFQCILLERVKDEHNKFLKSLEPPLTIPKNKITRWHPDFDLENCDEIECARLPQPPNMEKYSSARDILSTARNLFNCATPMERALERYEAKVEAERIATENLINNQKNVTISFTQTTSTGGELLASKTDPLAATTTKQSTNTSQPTAMQPAPIDVTTTLLKGVPKSLLEKIRAKQAAKALDAMTRRPSQDQEATKYSRLPEMARHLRNVFITERKGVLTLEIIIKKIQNSFRTSLLPQEIEAHLKLIAKEIPEWIAFHEVRKTMYLKIDKNLEMNEVIKKLEELANSKSK